jgi:BlaI family transcriptional regulator, penicillinase repressor
MTDEPRKDVTDAELAVMQVLWSRPAASIRQVTDVLYPKGSASHYATVQKLLDRLEAKGFVSRDRSLYVHLFSAAVGREDLVGQRIQRVVDTLCEGSLVPVLTHLASAKGLTEQERKALRQLVRRRKGADK